MASPKDISTAKKVLPVNIAIAGFVNMLSVGTMYALGVLGAELPRLLKCPDSWRFSPFAAASLGLTVGVATSASVMSHRGSFGTTAAGTALWGIGVLGAGLCVQTHKLELLLLCLALGGIGVGWTYLAAIIFIGRAFPDLALIRSAIGPIGFSSGAATAIWLSNIFEIDTFSSLRYGTALIYAGIAFFTVGIATHIFLGDTGEQSFAKATTDSALRCRAGYSALLFFNALPGMVLFALISLLPSLMQASGVSFAKQMLPCTLIALGISGPLAPLLATKLGPRNTFIALFCLRGLLLITTSYSRSPSSNLASLFTIFLGHGVGFGTLPGLIQKHSDSVPSFAHDYGKVLVAWGVSGVVGCYINSVIVASPEDIYLVTRGLGVALLCVGPLLFSIYI